MNIRDLNLRDVNDHPELFRLITDDENKRVDERH